MPRLSKVDPGVDYLVANGMNRHVEKDHVTDVEIFRFQEILALNPYSELFDFEFHMLLTAYGCGGLSCLSTSVILNVLLYQD